jgi:hypothetical protein
MLTTNSLPIPETEFRDKFAQYQAAVKAHADTEGVPAPFPEYAFFRTILAHGGEFRVEPAPVPESSVAADEPKLTDRQAVRKSATVASLVEALIAKGVLDPSDLTDAKATVASDVIAANVDRIR